MNKILFKTKISILILIIVVMSVLVFFLSKNNFSKLIINTNQTDSKITITGNNYESVKIGVFNESIPNDLYNIKIEKDGFITEELQINLVTDKDLNLKLFPSLKSKIDTSYKKENTVNLSAIKQDENNYLYGINRANGNLVKFEGDEIKILYEGYVKSYSTNKNYTIILENNKTDRIYLLDNSTLKIKEIDLSTISPISDITISESNDIYLLAMFNLKTKSSNLYKTDLSGNNIQLIKKTLYSQSIEMLNDDTILLITENHDIDKNKIDFYSFSKNKIINSKLTSWYNISPHKNYILLHRSKAIEIFDVENNTSINRNIKESSRSVWKDNNTLYIFRNSESSSYYTKIIINPFEIQPFEQLLNNVQIQYVFGFNKNRVILQDYKENIFSVELE